MKLCRYDTGHGPRPGTTQNGYITDRIEEPDGLIVAESKEEAA